eukprot:10344455-Ditylum_brightwellii.AAC.1
MGCGTYRSHATGLYCDGKEHDTEEHHDVDKGSEGIGEDETSIVQPTVVLDEDSILSDEDNNENELVECFNCHHR